MQGPLEPGVGLSELLRVGQQATSPMVGNMFPPGLRYLARRWLSSMHSLKSMLPMGSNIMMSTCSGSDLFNLPGDDHDAAGDVILFTQTLLGRSAGSRPSLSLLQRGR